MALLLNSTHAPPEGQKLTFGFVQTEFGPSTYTEYYKPLEECKRCGSSKIPTLNGTCECPICSPEIQFNMETMKIGGGLPSYESFTVLFDLAMPVTDITKYLKEFAEAISDQAAIYLIAIADFPIIIQSANGVVRFNAIHNGDDLSLDGEIPMIKEDFIESALPSLGSLQSAFKGSLTEKTVSVIPSIKAGLLISPDSMFILFAHREVTPVKPAEAKNIGAAMVENLRVLNTFSNGSFLRLSALASHTLGRVERIGTVSIKHVIESTQPVAATLSMPRYLEPSKVTSAIGNMRTTSNRTQVILSAIRGTSCKIDIDEASNEMPEEKGCLVLETCANVEGSFMRLHRIFLAEDMNEYNSGCMLPLTNALVLKAVASDILRACWDGADIVKTIQKKNNLAVLRNHHLTTLGQDPEGDILALYATLTANSHL